MRKSTETTEVLVFTIGALVLIAVLALLAGCASLEQDPEHNIESATRICMRTTPGGWGYNQRFQDCIRSYGHK